MFGGAPPQCRQRVAALQRRHDPSFRVLGGDLCDFARDPCVVGLGQLEVGERILAVRVESGRDQDQLRAMLFERGQPARRRPLRETRSRRCPPRSGTFTIFGSSLSSPE